MTKRQVISALRAVAKYYGIKASFTKTLGGIGGFVLVEERTVILDTTRPIPKLISSFFHELAHIHNYDEKKFWVYHQPVIPFKPFRVGFFQTALRAEMFTDKVGKQLQAVHFPGTRYVGGYKKSDRNFLRKYYLAGEL